jgi:hypothetical protein
MLPWVLPFQGFPAATFRRGVTLRDPLTRLAELPCGDPDVRLRVSIGRRVAVTVDRTEVRAVAAAFLGFPHLADPAHSGAGRAGYVFTLRRVVRCRRPAAALCATNTLPELTGPHRGAES